MSRRVRFTNGRDMELVGLLDEPDTTPSPGVILSHSFTGYKEIPHLHAIAKKLLDRGFTVLRFDFSDCVGESDGKCEDIQLSSQIDDLEHALDFLREQDGVDPDRMGLAGHSLGGMTSIMVAARYDIQALAPAGSPAYAELAPLVGGADELQRWEDQGFYQFDSVKKGSVRVNWSFVEDLRQYDARDAIEKVNAPIRVIHGDRDETVPLSHGEALFRHSNQPKQLHVLAGSDHLYTSDGAQRELVLLTADWMERQLRP